PDAIVVDTSLPPSSATLHAVLASEWPRLNDRVTFVQRALEDVDIRPDDIVVSSHACGALTDLVLERAVRAGARVGVLPCCHDLGPCEAGSVRGWVDAPLAIDIERVYRLRQHGYRVWTQTISADITPKNRLLFGAPASRTLSREPPKASGR